MFYVGKQKISPGFFSRGESSGDVVTATNHSGKNISAGDKVWINPYYYEAGTTTYVESGQYFRGNGYVSKDGHYVITTGYNGGKLMNIDGSSLGEVSCFYRSYNCVNETSDGIWYSSNSDRNSFQRLDSGLGWVRQNNKFIKGTSEYATDTSLTHNIYKIDNSTGETIKTYINEDKQYSCDRIVYIGNNKFLAGIEEYPYAVSVIQLNDEDNSWSVINSNVFDSFNDGIVGVTSDYKYVLCLSNKIIDTETFQNVYNTIDFPASLNSNYDYSVCYFDTKENIYQTHYGTLANNTDPKNYKVVKYDITTKTWSVISIDYETIMGGTDRTFIRACFNNGIMTSAFYASNDWGCTVAQITNDEGYNLIKYGIEVTSDTLTGVAKENINGGEEGRVTTILP